MIPPEALGSLARASGRVGDKLPADARMVLAAAGKARVRGSRLHSRALGSRIKNLRLWSWGVLRRPRDRVPLRHRQPGVAKEGLSLHRGGSQVGQGSSSGCG